MPDLDINIRPAVKGDLDAINQVIKAAVTTWKLPERVIRLSLPSYLYTDLDFVHFDMLVAIDQNHNIVGVAAWVHILVIVNTDSGRS